MEAKKLFIKRDVDGVAQNFPIGGAPAIVGTFTYTAKRMGGAPAISATVYYPTPLDKAWSHEEYIELMGEKYYATSIPSSSKDNETLLYKHDITFTSRREVLDNTLFFDVVSNDEEDTQGGDKYRSNQTKFTFGGDITEFVSRINSSMKYCGVPYSVVIDDGYATTDVKEVSFEDQYLTEVLQLINTTYELSYYWIGNVCHVGKVQNDLTSKPVEYGRNNALTSVSKENSNAKIVDMITGYGSSDNLQWYYPNEDQFGSAVFSVKNYNKNNVSVDLNKLHANFSNPYNKEFYLSRLAESTYSNNCITRRTVNAPGQAWIDGTQGIGGDKGTLRISAKFYCMPNCRIKLSNVKINDWHDGDAEIGCTFSARRFSIIKNGITETKNELDDNYICDEEGVCEFVVEEDYQFHCAQSLSEDKDHVDGTAYLQLDGYATLEFKSDSGYFITSSDDNKQVKLGGSGINIEGDVENVCATSTYEFYHSQEEEIDGGYKLTGVTGKDKALTITVSGRSWILPSSTLMPSIYRTSGGAERFYYAKNDTYQKPDGSGDYYEFANLYTEGNPHQGSVSYDDIKPTINGMTNASGQLIGEIADVAFDSANSDATDADNNYIHPYFYIKLHKFDGDYGFDLFKHALATESAKIEMIDCQGCPACSFAIQCVWSADNATCYNPVSVDANGNLLTVATEKNDYILGNTKAYEATINQDSSKEELWIAVQKDTSTLGIVMPNAAGGFMPQKGDKFVITGISLPAAYIEAAEKRLDEALIKYMSENNEDQFNYSIKFSRIFLQENQDFANKLNENSKIAVSYAGETHEFFVSNYTVKVDDNALAEVEVELTNTLSTSDSELKKTIDAVKGETVSQLKSLVNSGVNSFNANIADRLYLSKVSNDIAQGLIEFTKGFISDALSQLKGGATFGNSGYKFDKDGNVVVDALTSLAFDETLQRGFGFTKNTSGKYTLSVTDLMVWGKAVFNSLEIRKLYAVGGNVYLSGASSKIQYVTEVKDTDGNITGWKCYILADDGTTATQNGWVKYDQAKCQTFDIQAGTYENVSNTFYWRLVTDVSTENEAITETTTETYTDADGNEQTREVTTNLYDGKKFGWVVLSKSDCESATNDTPKAGDTIVLDGHRQFATGDAEGRDKYNDASRTNVMMLETTGTDASLPRIVALTGITDYKHSESDNAYSNTVFILSPSEVVFVSSSIKWISATGDPITFVNFRGAWVEGTSYSYYDQVSYNNSIWTCIVEKGKTTTLEPNDGNSSVWRKEISGDSSANYGVSLTYEKRTVSSVTQNALIVTFTKSGAEGVTTSNNVKSLDSNYHAEIYVDGVLDSATTQRLNNGTSEAGELYELSYPQAFTAKYITVKWYDSENGNLLGMGSITRGADGEAAVTYEVQVSSYSEYVNSGRVHGLQFQFAKVTGATRQTVTDVREIGCVIAINTAAYIYTDAANYINEGNSHFLFPAYPVANVTMDEADNITVKMYLSTDTEKENPVAVANFANGKQGADGMGALEISVSPDTLVFDTDDNGLVNSSTTQTATITCTRAGEDATDKCSFAVGSQLNCGTASMSGNVITVGGITSQQVKLSDGTTTTISNTNGYVNVTVTDEKKVAHTVTVRFSVNVAKFNGGMVANNKKFETVYNELTNNGSSTDLTWYESKIEQTARNVSLKVQEKNVGRRNMLVGSAFKKQEDGIFALRGSYISINDGYEGTNCTHVVNQYSGTQNYYGVFWDGSNGGSSIKIDRKKKYILSCWVKSGRVDVDIYLGTLFTDKQVSAKRVNKSPKTSYGKFTPTAASTWELIQMTIDPSVFGDDGTENTQYEYMAVNIFCTHTLSGVTCHTYICRPMLEEGEEYNGWTLSEQDYDYVGGNLLDNTGTLTKDGNLDTTSGTITQNGYGESATIRETLAAAEQYSDFLIFATAKMGLKANEDYILSFYAKADSAATAGKLQTYMHPGAYANTEDCAGGDDNRRNPEDSSLLYGIVPTTSWKRYWVHWRPTSVDSVQYVRFRLMPYGTVKGTYSSTETYAVDDYVLYGSIYWRCKATSKGNTPSSSSSYWETVTYNITIAKPKLEVGATMTEWTEKRADMVDKQALLATGIDIENKKITLTADKTYLQTNAGTPVVLIDSDGYIVNSAINASALAINADQVTVSATHALTISGNGAMIVDMDNFKLDAKGNATLKGSINSTSGTISFFTFTDSGMYSGAVNNMGLGLRMNNISVVGAPGSKTSLVCLGDGRKNSITGTDTYPASIIDTGYNVNYSNLIQVTGGGTGNGRDAAALGIETDGDYCLSAMGGLSHLQGLALAAETVTNSPYTADTNKTLFIFSGAAFTMPANPKPGQLVIVIQASSSQVTYNGNGKSFCKGTTTASTVSYRSVGRMVIFVYDSNSGYWRYAYAS